MIRFKDQIFEEYSIDPVTAVITDKNGVEQLVKIYKNGRPYFKRMLVHCIMCHTFYGYKTGYDVHHLDENKLNNALSNLVYLTHEEHIRLHHKDKQKSDETRAKISASMTGKKRGPYKKKARVLNDSPGRK